MIPTSYGRNDANLYIHGSAASRMLRQMKEGVPVCVTVTLLDGLVLARSIFNHSMNYRSVVILGKATLVDDPAEKLAALRVLSEHILPGRWDDVRQPNERELKATSVLRVPIEEFSAKVRQGPAIDDAEDYAFPTWAGVVPLEMVAGDADRRCAAHTGKNCAGIRSRLHPETLNRTVYTRHSGFIVGRAALGCPPGAARHLELDAPQSRLEEENPAELGSADSRGRLSPHEPKPQT